MHSSRGPTPEVPSLRSALQSIGAVALVEGCEMTADELFLFAVDDLEGRTQLGQGEYDALMMAALLRKLLIDDTPLIHVVNRERRLALRFRVTDIGPPKSVAPEDCWMPNDAFHPDGAGPNPAVVE